VIIHGAAYTQVDAAESDPEGAWAVNVEGTRAVVEAAAETAALLVYVSTDYVFSGERAEPYLEEHPTGPVSRYGATKLEGERVAATLDRHLIVRTSWVFGEGRNFVRAVLRAAAAASGSGKELPVVDDQRGRPTYAVDLAAGILALVERGAAGTYHLQGGGDPGTWADVAEAALASAGIPVEVRRVGTAEYEAGRSGPDGRPVARRPANGVLDCSKAAACGVRLRPWREAIDAYVKVVGP
jgi:dTDP-4-dehydrorhamnose 3,5-epimerase